MEKLTENKFYRFTNPIPYKSGTVVQDEKGNRFVISSSLDLEWLVGDYKKEGYNSRYYVTAKYIGNFKVKKKDKDPTNNTSTELEEPTAPIPQ